MKNRFEEFSVLSKSSILHLFKDCIFVFDTNILLNMYRYSEDTSSSWFEALGKIKNRVYLPYIIGYEFYKNRLETIESENRIPSKINAEIEKFSRGLEKQFQESRRLNDKSGDLKKILKRTHEQLLKTINHKKIDISKDHILQKIESLFLAESVGEEISLVEKHKLIQEAKRRFDEKIPPGFEDVKKDSVEQYNDFLFWHDVLTKATTDKVDVILVTDDAKSDWWKIQVNENKAVFLPHPLLRKEFNQKTKQKYFQLTAGDFIALLTEFNEQKVDHNVISETNEVSQTIQENMANENQNEIHQRYVDRIKSRLLEQNESLLIKYYAEEEAKKKALIDLLIGSEYKVGTAMAVPGFNIPLPEMPNIPIPDFKIPMPEITNIPVPGFNIPLPEMPNIPIPDFAIPMPEISNIFVPGFNIPVPEMPNNPALEKAEIPIPKTQNKKRKKK